LFVYSQDQWRSIQWLITKLYLTKLYKESLLFPCLARS
jgi:hypothetical protein